MKLVEIKAEDQEPLLVTLINQRLLAGDTVLIDIERGVGQPGEAMTTFRYSGILVYIAALQGDIHISFSYVSAGRDRKYGRAARGKFAASNFDDLYTLVKGTSPRVWRLVNV